MRKIAIIGRGTAGCYSVTHFLRWTDWEIVWYFDSNTPTQSVGEGAPLYFSRDLHYNIGFMNYELPEIDGTFKCAIPKENWGSGEYFVHNFVPPEMSIHFNAVKLQNYILNKLKGNPRITFVDKNVSHDEIDTDFIMDCSGRPSAKDSDKLIPAEYIPVNSVHVTQCYWNRVDFQYSLCIARPYGWVFGIPLQNRCSIGYMYNNNINSLEEIKEDVKAVFEDKGLTPSSDTNSFSLSNYYRKNNLEGRVAYNGNASFFLEPLEATSIHSMALNMKLAHNVWAGRHANDPNAEANANAKYLQDIQACEKVIMLHYKVGSIFKTPFWDFAQDRGERCFANALETDKEFVLRLNKDADQYQLPLYGSWPTRSWKENLIGLGYDKLGLMKDMPMHKTP
jgi:hypothetical protein